jgi:hypothetical protein
LEGEGRYRSGDVCLTSDYVFCSYDIFAEMTYWRWKYFRPQEVLSPKGLELHSKGFCMIQPQALDQLEAIRKHFDTPFYVNRHKLKLRGYRSPKENESAGGASDSYHMYGMACRS